MRAMKDSGIEWIGEIPEEWEYVRLKYNTILKGRIGWQGLKADEFTDEGPYLVTGTDFDNGKIDFNRSYHITEERYNEAPEIQLKVNDLIVTKDGTVGKLAYIDDLPDKASLNSHLLLIRPTKDFFTNRYLFWLMGSSVFTWYTQYSQNGTIMASLSQEKISNFFGYIPNIEIQETIVNYLNYKCARIDSFIAKEQEVITKLQEYKLSLITEKVTKGLNPNVEMKDSGIEWIGEIPKHCTLVKIKYLTSKIGSGKTPKGGAEIYQDTGVPFLRSQNVHDTGLEINTVFFISDEIDEEMRSTRVYKDDVLLNITGGSIGRCCIYNASYEHANVNQHVCIIRPIRNQLLPAFLKLFWNSKAGKTSIDIYQSGANREGMNFEQIGNTVIPCFSTVEQQEIVDYLDTKCAAIDAAIAKKQALIEKFTEYKKSLIYEVVTGKKEV